MSEEEYYEFMKSLHNINKEITELKCKLNNLYLKRTKEEKKHD